MNYRAQPTQPTDAAWTQARPSDVTGAMRGIYWWMTAGLALTGAVALLVASSPAARGLVFGTPFLFLGLIIAELVMVIALVAALPKLSPGAATALFLGYSALNGVTLSFVFLAYTGASVASTFFATAGTFGAMAVYGTVTKRDLTGVGHFAFMGLIGLIIASVVNIFVHSEMLYWGITYAGVLVFVLLSAFDVQRLRRMAAAGRLPRQKLAIFGALQLYLDFINLFLFLLRLLGDRR